jgi:hypothetical protein
VKPHAAIELACGLAVSIVLAAAITRAPRAVLAKLRWEFALLAIVLAICMLPSAGMFRFSFRSLALFHVVLALIAAEAFRIASRDAPAASRSHFGGNLGTWAVAVVAVTAIASPAFGLPSLEYGPRLWLMFAIAAVLWWIVQATRDAATSSQEWALPLVTFATLFATYLAVPPHAAVARFGLDANLNDVAPLDPNRLYLSLYRSPPEHYRGDQTGGWFGTITRPGSISMFAGVHLINGYSPVGPAGISRLLDFGTHGHINPPRIADVVLAEAGRDGLLAKLGIDGILVASDLELPARLPANWHIVYSTWEGNVWHRDVALPHVRALADEHHSDANVTIVENSRQRVIAEIAPADRARPVLLAFSRPYFPGYHARLDGKPLAVTSINGLAPTLELPAGQSGRVTLVYQPRAVTIGGALAGATLAATAFAWFVMSRRDRLVRG